MRRCHLIQGLSWLLCPMFSLFLFSCAGQPSRTLPAENLPQIGARQETLSLESPRPKIIIRLIKKAEQQIAATELDKAFTTLEQAVDIDAQDPFLWHLLAKIQLLQGNLHQAEQLARKSDLLAAHSPLIRGKNKEIITRVLELQGQ
jgi:cytochrome c-type biogenesis protein CcmH/NrfG